MNTIAVSDSQSAKVDTRWFQNQLADRHISQRKLAKLLDLDPAAVSLMFRGRRKMSAAEAAEVSRVLNVDVDEVLRRAGIGLAVVAAAKPVKDVKAATVAPAMEAAVVNTSMIDVPVPMADGSTATLSLPRAMTRADAERIAALVQALAMP